MRWCLWKKRKKKEGEVDGKTKEQRGKWQRKRTWVPAHIWYERALAPPGKLTPNF